MPLDLQNKLEHTRTHILIYNSHTLTYSHTHTLIHSHTYTHTQITFIHAHTITFIHAYTLSSYTHSQIQIQTYEISREQAMTNAFRLVKEAGAHAIKLEGGVRNFEQIRGIVQSGIAVCGHTGLTPQSVSAIGGFRSMGASFNEAKTVCVCMKLYISIYVCVCVHILIHRLIHILIQNTKHKTQQHLQKGNRRCNCNPRSRSFCSSIRMCTSRAC